VVLHVKFLVWFGYDGAGRPLLPRMSSARGMTAMVAGRVAGRLVSGDEQKKINTRSLECN
jgi:hypothetical protein